MAHRCSIDNLLGMTTSHLSGWSRPIAPLSLVKNVEICILVQAARGAEQKFSALEKLHLSRNGLPFFCSFPRRHGRPPLEDDVAFRH